MSSNNTPLLAAYAEKPSATNDLESQSSVLSTDGAQDSQCNIQDEKLKDPNLVCGLAAVHRKTHE